MFGGDITQYVCNAGMTEQASVCCAPVSTTAECTERDHRYVQAIAAIQPAAQATQDDLRNLLVGVPGGFFDFGDRQAKNQPQHITKTTNHTFPRALV